MKKILIYSDKGASFRCVKALLRSLRQEDLEKRYSISLISHQEVTGVGLQNAALLIFPGGRDIPYSQALQGSGNNEIKKYVQKGGRYLGICAGAYYGCGQVEFEKGTDLEVMEKRELNFFPGIAKGALYETGSFCYKTEKGARISTLSLSPSQKKLASYYNGGCTFLEVEKHEGVHPLAFYDDLEGKPPAIIECSLGDGKAVLCGVHPEFSALHLQSKDPYLTALLPALKDIETQRKSLFRLILNRLGCVSNLS